jgi:hypothetical protein
MIRSLWLAMGDGDGEQYIHSGGWERVVGESR